MLAETLHVQRVMTMSSPPHCSYQLLLTCKRFLVVFTNSTYFFFRPRPEYGVSSPCYLLWLQEADPGSVEELIGCVEPDYSANWGKMNVGDVRGCLSSSIVLPRLAETFPRRPNNTVAA